MTAQVPEMLILDGRQCDMTACPLKENHPRVRRRREDEMRAPAPSFIGSTACWRGYLGTWEIKDKRLYLVKLQGRLVLDGTGPLFADWVDQIIVVLQGRLVEYVHMGFMSRYECELRIHIGGGLETNREMTGARLQARIDGLPEAGHHLEEPSFIADLAIIAGPQAGEILPIKPGHNDVQLAHGGRLSLGTGEPAVKLLVHPSGELVEHLFRPRERLLGVDEPALPPQGYEQFSELLRISEWRQSTEEHEMAGRMCLGKLLQHEPAEQTRQHQHWQEEARFGRDPALAVGREATTRHDHVHMGMVRHGAAPGVQHGSDADPGAVVLRLGRDRRHRLGGGLEQQVIDGRLVVVGDGTDLLGQREDDMEVGYWQ